jgi:hypothetical protein
MTIEREERQYQVTMRVEDGSCETVTTTIDEGTESEQDAQAEQWAREATEEWVRDGDWGDEGARVLAWYTLADEDDEWTERDIEVDIEPDHEALILAAGGDTECDHEWTSEGEGGCASNPGVWSTGGTSLVISEHCTLCGLHRTYRITGSQYNPGECNTVEYCVPEDTE